MHEDPEEAGGRVLSIPSKAEQLVDGPHVGVEGPGAALLMHMAEAAKPHGRKMEWH